MNNTIKYINIGLVLVLLILIAGCSKSEVQDKGIDMAELNTEKAPSLERMSAEEYMAMFSPLTKGLNTALDDVADVLQADRKSVV